jgi:RNA polymerase sigma factor (sigma-70 family)
MQDCIKKNNHRAQYEVLEEDKIIPYKDDDEVVNKLTEITDESMQYDNDKKDEEKMVLINEIIKKLPQRGQYIIQSYYGFNEKEKNLEEIGAVVGLTKERVRQIKEQCLRLLRSEVLMSENFNDLFVS